MGHGHALTRTELNDEIYFFIKDADGKKLYVKQTLRLDEDNKICVDIEADERVNIVRGEELEKSSELTLTNET